jgi:hypothetical protein
MSQPPQNTSLSLSTRLTLYLGPPSVILLASLASPKTGLLSPLAFLPTVSAYLAWSTSNTHNPSQRAPLSALL